LQSPIKLNFIMEEKNINPIESLEIINSMINTAKNKLADDGFLYIFWGWLVFAAALGNYAFIMFRIPGGEWIWATLMPLGGLISLIYGNRKGRKEKSKTYIDTYLGYSWSAIIIAIILTLVFMGQNGFKSSYFFLMVLYGVATLVSGGFLNFKPLIYGSSISFVFAIVSMFANDEQLLICIAVAIMGSYIIPGHLLYNKYKSQADV